MNNIKVKFECDSSEYMELRNKSVWVAVHNKLVIMKNKRSRRKEGWIEKLITELYCSTGIYHVSLNREDKDKIVINFFDFNLIGSYGFSQEECCNDIGNVGEMLKKSNEKI
ncbi:hypothetical protein [Clostridium perfringens]|uniref:hypothetical protein n=1 Tax=Clostridium perfringens TaxID=1502 RepID=UPI00224681FC|nr:hypothetical protein [Clostridium perfringens]MCX0380885.1 hypothetical protein [Clostridium perfringens]